MIRVFLADDHAVLRDGIHALIEAQTDMTVVGEASDGQRAIAGCRELQPDVAVLDVAMPGCGGIEATGAIRQSCAATRVLILTMHETPEILGAAVTAGASGYVAKSTAGRELVGAIRDVHQGRSPIRASFAGDSLPAPFEAGVAPAQPALESDHLSQREGEVLEGLALGYTNKEIAEQLGLAPKSVDTYRIRLQTKLGLKGRAQLVRYALDHGFLKPGRG